MRVFITGSDPYPIEVGVGPVQVAVTHEEADVTMAHYMLIEAKNKYSPINVVSDDTDVLLILCHHLNILFETDCCVSDGDLVHLTWIRCYMDGK